MGNFTPEEYEECAAGSLSATWDEFVYICNNTRLPVIAKGVMTGVPTYIL
jgi:hypothetical protein